MNLPPLKPALSNKQGDDFAISTATLLELMQAVLAKGAVFRFRAKGLSMTPFIKSGDEITVAPASMEKPAVGKVVAFIQPATGQLVVHRVIGRQGSAFLIQGDNAVIQEDELVPPEAVLGCVTRIERDGRRVFLGLGLERYLVAFLSRSGLLARLLWRLRTLKG